MTRKLKMSDTPTIHNDDHTKQALQAQRTELELRLLNSKVTEQVTVFRAHVEDNKVESEKHIAILEKISDQVDQTQKCLDKLDNKVDLSYGKLQSEIEKINQLDMVQNDQLAVHIKGVNTNTERLELQRTESIERIEIIKKEYELRLTELEKPGEWWKMTKRGILAVGTLAAAIAAILKLLEVI